MDEMIRTRVNGPSLALMVTSGLSILLQVFNVLASMIGWVDPYENPYFSPVAQMGMSAVAVLVGVFIIVAAGKMRALQSFNFALAGGIVACIPCISPCCVLTLPAGIWALVVMMKPEVKAAFSS